MLRRAPRLTLFPYTTLFRSRRRLGVRRRLGPAPGGGAAGRQRPGDAEPEQAARPPQEPPPTRLHLRSPFHLSDFGTVPGWIDRKSTRLNSSHLGISYAVFCLNAPARPETYTLSLHDALPISPASWCPAPAGPRPRWGCRRPPAPR